MANQGKSTAILVLAASKHLIESNHQCLVHYRYSQGSHSAVSIANSVQAFITTMDSLKLNMAAVDQVFVRTQVKVPFRFVHNLPKLIGLALQIYPLMSDLLTNLNKVCAASCIACCGQCCAPECKSKICGTYWQLLYLMAQVEGFPAEFQGKGKVKTWISKLHSMPASQELTENESRQLLFDLESSYNEFMSVLPQLQGS